MLLTPMRYKTYVWPHNPASYSITYERQTAVHKVPFGRYYIQDMGPACRVMRGWGEFAGKDAYREFKQLAAVFSEDGPGLLVHPLWQISNAYFTDLKLEQEPVPDYVRYSFVFRERFDGYSGTLTELSAASGGGEHSLPGGESGGGTGSGPSGEISTGSDFLGNWGARTHIVASGETLWGIAARYQVSLYELLDANRHIRNPNFLWAGERLVIPC